MSICVIIVVNALAFDLLKQNYADRELSKDELLALINCSFKPAREFALKQLDSRRVEFINDPIFLANVFTSKADDNRITLKSILQTSSLNDSLVQEMVSIIISRVVEMGDGSANLIKSIAEHLPEALGDRLKVISFELITLLLSKKKVALSELAVKLLIKMDKSAAELPGSLIEGLINSEEESIRVSGIQLLSQFSDFDLIDRQNLLIELASSKREDVRNAIMPAIIRLAKSQPSFAESIRQAFVIRLCRGRLTKDALDQISAYLIKYQLTELKKLPSKEILKLLTVNVEAANKLGGKLTDGLVAEELSHREIIELASNEVFNARQASCRMIQELKESVKSNMPKWISILDAKWDDSREFCFNFFRTEFDKSDFSIEALVQICDSVNEQVQKFGQEMLITHFNDADAEEYLKRLAEHPGRKIQLFVSSFVETYAKDNLENLISLEQFIRISLTKVNKGRINKQRLLHFLEIEAVKSPEAAKYVSQILNRHSASYSIETRASSILILTRIKKVYPDLELPLIIKNRELRNAV